jgi:hypothetical protein
MDNGHLHDDKLFRAVNERLSDYEAPYNGADWDAMSRSLDKLPKTSRFQWKISLNSLIVGVAIAGLSVLGYTLAAGNGSAAPAPQAMQEVKPSPRTVKTSLPANTLQATTTAPQPTTVDPQTALTGSPGNNPMVNTMADMMAGQQQAGKSKRNSSKLRFGDEIDPRKGFIYETREDKNIINQAPVDKTPNTYYDLEGGKLKKIVIDSTTHTGEKKEIPEPQQTETPSTPGAPIQGGPTGFGEIGGEGN